MTADLSRRLVAELLGTGFLLLAVVGSGIMAQRLSLDPGLALLENTLATAATLHVAITLFGPVSGAHFNPVVTVWARSRGDLTWAEAGAYTLAQLVGAGLGVGVANASFGVAAGWASTSRATPAVLGAEVVATLGLLLVIAGLVRSRRPQRVPFGVAAYVAGAYWFTSSTSFANPAVTVARTLSDTFAGIAPLDVPSFIAAQAVGGALGIIVARHVFVEIPGGAEREAPAG